MDCIILSFYEGLFHCHGYHPVNVFEIAINIILWRTMTLPWISYFEGLCHCHGYHPSKDCHGHGYHSLQDCVISMDIILWWTVSVRWYHPLKDYVIAMDDIIWLTVSLRNTLKGVSYCFSPNSFFLYIIIITRYYSHGDHFECVTFLRKL